MGKHNRNFLVQLLRAKKITLAAVQKALDISQPTTTKYMRDPMLMNGHDRHKMAALLSLDPIIIDRLINGEFTDIQPLLKVK